jgi:hypothetical protein
MNAKKLGVLTFISVVFLAQPGVSARPPETGSSAKSTLSASPKSRLEMKQLHRIYGRLDVVITRDGAKVKGTGTDYAFVCSAPDWDVVLYSDARKLVARKPYSDWSKNGFKTALNIMNNQALYKWPRTLVGKKNYRGLNATIYAFPHRYENGFPADLKFGKFGEYMISSGVPANKKVESFLQALYDCPPAEGIPLKFTKYGQGNSFGLGLKYNEKVESISILDTIQTKWDNAPVSFALPQVKSYRRVLESDIVVKNDDFSDVFSNLMNDGSKKQPK